MAVEERTIELTVISATDLKRVRKFGRKQCYYAMAYIYPTRMMASDTDSDGDVNPTWNSALTLTCHESLLQQHESCINVDIFSHGSIFRKNKFVGSAKILLQDVVPNEQFMALEVLLRRGRVQGTLNVSVKLGEKRPFGLCEEPVAAGVSSLNTPSSQISGQHAASIHAPQASTASHVYPPDNGAAYASGFEVDPQPPSFLKKSNSACSEEPVMGYPVVMSGGYPALGTLSQNINEQPPPSSRRGRRDRKRARRLAHKIVVLSGAAFLALLLI